MHIIIRSNNKYGKTRSEIESNLRKDGLTSLSEEQYDKCKFLEKKIKEKHGIRNPFLGQKNINKIK